MAQDQAFDTALALSRFGLGSNAEGVSALTGDVRDRLLAEIKEGALQPSGLKATPELLSEIYAYQKRKQMEKQAEKADMMANPPQDTGAQDMSSENMNGQDMAAMAKKRANPDKDPSPSRDIIFDEVEARLNGTMRTPAIGFAERMVMFWANHFAVSVKKSQPLAMTAGAFEREAIRPNIFGRFADLLLAVETHPAMLLYLDNDQSIGPDAPAGRNGKRGLNENLAREILELHTMGVGSGYTQTDVTSFAKVITGWTVNKNDDRAPIGFVFFDRAHEPGAQTILGKTYRQSGMDQGKAVLDDLARHPATAQHIAAKLARHFVADDPPPELIARLADAFRKTDGDLAEVSRVLIASPEAWTAELKKMRSPVEYAIAAVRATGVPLKPKAFVAALNAMGQPWWQPGGPNGFPDTVAAWASPEGLSTRVDFANALANATDPGVDPRAFAASRLGALLKHRTAEAVARAETHAQGIALGLLSPEFMRR